MTPATVARSPQRMTPEQQIQAEAEALVLGLALVQGALEAQLTAAVVELIFWQALIQRQGVKDGSNWYAYVNNDPVNFTDPNGLFVNFAIGAVVGFVTSTVGEVAGRVASGQDLGSAVSNTFSDPTSLSVIGASTAIGAVTSGASGLAVSAATKGVTSIARVSALNVAGNAVGGAVGAAGADVSTKALKGQPQSVTDTLAKAATGAVVAGGTSAVVRAAIGATSMKVSTTLKDVTGAAIAPKIVGPKGSEAIGTATENVIPTAADVISALTSSSGSGQGLPSLSSINRVDDSKKGK